MDKLCCSNSFKERRSIYCYKNSLFTCSIRASRPVSRSSLVLSRKAAAKVKPFFVTTNFFRNFFFRKPFGFQKKQNLKNSCQSKAFPFLSGAKIRPFLPTFQTFSEEFSKHFLHIEQSCYYSARYKTSFQSSIYNIYRCTSNPHPTSLRGLCTPSGRPTANHPEERAAFAEKKSPHGPSRVPCGVRFGCAVSISRRSVRRLFASRSHSTTP